MRTVFGKVSQALLFLLCSISANDIGQICKFTQVCINLVDLSCMKWL